MKREEKNPAGEPETCRLMMTDASDLTQLRLEQQILYKSIPGFLAKFRVREHCFECLDANERFLHFFGVRRHGTLVNLETMENKATLEKNRELMRLGEPVRFTLQAQNQRGQYVWFDLNGECVDWMDGDPVYLMVYLDVTHTMVQRDLQKKKNAQLERLTFVDAVTGGLNRTGFECKAGKAVYSSPPGTYVLVWMDISKFKVINDFFGIELGNRTLMYVHNTLKSLLLEGEFVARIFADNFNLLLKADEKENLIRRLDAMAGQVNSYNFRLRNPYTLPLTAGIYLIDDLSLPMTRIQDRANVGRKNIKVVTDTRLCSCRFYSERERQQVVREKEMENSMENALKNQEFVVYLQPKQSLKNRTIAGAEALVRWNTPEYGMLAPDAFIPLFEQNQFIVELDLYVFEKVCALLRQWMECGVPPVPISVNMSRAHLANRHFFDRYEEIRRRYQIPPELLEIELTETLVFGNPQVLIQVIDQIRSYGYHCSMDDFGSGYSSLNLLKDIEVDTLKLDRAFFSSGELKNPRERDVITSVLELADKLHMTTVAEGVETPWQAQFLQQTTCDLLQGYVVSKPIPIRDFERMVFGQTIS